MCIRFLNIQVPENIIEYQMMPLKSYFFYGSLNIIFGAREHFLEE